jgi:hypothetical protein
LNGEKHGKGEWIFANGSRREGTFINNREDGESIQTNVDGTKEKQVWKKDAKQSSEKI